MTPANEDNSQLSRNIQDSLESIKCDGHLGNLDSIVEAGVKSPHFLTLVKFLIQEVSNLYQLKGHHDLQEADLNSEAGMMELSSFLRDLECPHAVLIEGAVTQRLADKKSRLLLLEYLLAEIKKSRETNDFVLEVVKVDSYGEVFQKNIKPLIRKRPFRDQITILSADEMKRQIFTSNTHTRPEIICPHPNPLKNLTHPGIEASYDISFEMPT